MDLSAIHRMEWKFLFHIYGLETVWLSLYPKKSTDPQSMLLYCGKNNRSKYLFPQYSVVGLCKNWAILDFFNVGWQYSDRKNSLNNFHFWFGNSLTKSLPKKVNRSTKHVTVLWKKQSPNISLSAIFRCGIMQKLDNFRNFGRWLLNVLLLRACAFFYLAVCFLKISQLFETRF